VELAGMVLENTEGVAQLSCPRCGSELIDRPTEAEREGARQFRGCSDYPTCPYTQGAAA
jgi:restriction system protein